MYRTETRSSQGKPAERRVSRLSASIAPVAALAWLLLFLAGCAPATKVTKVTPLPAELRTRLGAVAVTSIPFRRALVPATRSRSGALEGAGQGAMSSLRYGLDVCDGLGAIMPPVCIVTLVGTVLYAPVGALIGAAGGAAQERDRETQEAAQGQVPEALQELRPAEELRRRFLRLGTAKSDARLVDPDAAAKSDGTRDGDAPVDTDSMIRIEVTGFALASHDRSDSELSIELATRARIFLPLDPGPTYEHNWRYSGPRRHYFAETEDRTAQLQSDLDTAFETLAEKMVFDLLIATEPEVRRGEPKPGSAWSVDESKS